MVQNRPAEHCLRVAGDLFAVRDQVTDPALNAWDAERRQRVCHREEKMRVSVRCILPRREDRVVEIAHVVVYGAAAGVSAHHGDPGGPYLRQTDLFKDVLVPAAYHARRILPEHHDRLARIQRDKRLLRRDVDIRIESAVVDAEHISRDSAPRADCGISGRSSRSILRP